MTIDEIENSTNTSYSTRKQKEKAINLSYQVDCICGTTKLSDGTILNPAESAKLLATVIRKLLCGERYKMDKIGNSPLQSLTVDNTVIRCINRYRTCLVLEQDTLYNRR